MTENPRWQDHPFVIALVVFLQKLWALFSSQRTGVVIAAVVVTLILLANHVLPFYFPEWEQFPVPDEAELAARINLALQGMAVILSFILGLFGVTYRLLVSIGRRKRRVPHLDGLADLFQGALILRQTAHIRSQELLRLQVQLIQATNVGALVVLELF